MGATGFSLTLVTLSGFRFWGLLVLGIYHLLFLMRWHSPKHCVHSGHPPEFQTPVQRGPLCSFVLVTSNTISWTRTHCSQSLTPQLPTKYYCHMRYIGLPLKCVSRCNSRYWKCPIKTYVARNQGIWGNYTSTVISTCPTESEGGACYRYCLLNNFIWQDSGRDPFLPCYLPFEMSFPRT